VAGNVKVGTGPGTGTLTDDRLAGLRLPQQRQYRERLAAGGLVADVGCGHGASTIIMAAAYPNSSFHGFDYHEESIEAARKAGVALIPGVGFDVVPSDCLAAHLKRRLPSATGSTILPVLPRSVV